jgi:hypothetical protein
LSDSRGTFVSLSHHCPTAALLLFRDDATLEPVLNPPMCAGRTFEGFDATRSYPPLLRPKVLFDLAAYDIWERFVVRTCARQDLAPECVLALVATTAERIRSWTARQGPLQEFVQQATEPEREVQNDVVVDLEAFERQAGAARRVGDDRRAPRATGMERVRQTHSPLSGGSSVRVVDHLPGRWPPDDGALTGRGDRGAASRGHPSGGPCRTSSGRRPAARSVSRSRHAARASRIAGENGAALQRNRVRTNPGSARAGASTPMTRADSSPGEIAS